MIEKAILAINPNASFSSGNDINRIRWHDGNPNNITVNQIQAKIAELQAAEPLRQLRQQRNKLLSATDWWVLPDRTATQAQLNYRQTLRDLPTNSPNAALDENGQLTGITWPTPPND
jgi:hypothetical protein